MMVLTMMVMMVVVTVMMLMLMISNVSSVVFRMVDGVMFPLESFRESAHTGLYARHL